jgi:hypothetical protein
MSLVANAAVMFWSRENDNHCQFNDDRTTKSRPIYATVGCCSRTRVKKNDANKVQKEVARIRFGSILKKKPYKHTPEWGASPGFGIRITWT